jgi:hypothetical protein
MCGLVQLAWPVIKETTMNPTGNSNEVTKPKLTVACFAAAFLLRGCQERCVRRFL